MLAHDALHGSPPCYASGAEAAARGLSTAPGTIFCTDDLERCIWARGGRRRSWCARASTSAPLVAGRNKRTALGVAGRVDSPIVPTSRVALTGMTVAMFGAVAGCGAHSETGWYGTVTSLRPLLCVGRHAATGECFVAGPATVAVRVGECVRVTFRPSTPAGGLHPTLLTIGPAHASEHVEDCPS